MDDDKVEVTEGEPSAKRRRTSSTCKQRPNFFVAVQISNPEIHREISVLQKFIVTKKPLFKSTLINLITLHITLCTLHLPKNGDIRKAKSALKTLETNMKENLIKEPISLKFRGIGSFKNEVIFAKIESGEPLTRFKGLHLNLIEALKDEGLIVSDKFEPHLTIMKMSKDRHLFKKKIRKVPKDLYEEHNEKLFGDQMVKGVQLLKMTDRSPDEYYQCYHHFDLGLHSNETENHELCCGVQSVFPSSLIEVNPESSDDETEEMFHDAKEVLDEAKAIEESEIDDALKYIQKFDASEEVIRDSSKYVVEKGNIHVEVIHSGKISLKGKKVQNKRMKRKRYKVCNEGANVESSLVKTKVLEIEEAEDFGLKFLLEEMEAENVKVIDVDPQSGDVIQTPDQGGATEVEACTAQIETSGNECSQIENADKAECSIDENGEFTKSEVSLEDMESKSLMEDKHIEELKLTSDHDVGQPLAVVEKMEMVSTQSTDSNGDLNDEQNEKKMVATHSESSENVSTRDIATRNNSSTEMDELKARLEALKKIGLKDSTPKKETLDPEEAAE